MTAQEQTAAIERLTEELQALKERAQEICNRLDYKAGSRFSRAVDALEQAQRHAATAANLTRIGQRA